MTSRSSGAGLVSLRKITKIKAGMGVLAKKCGGRVERLYTCDIYPDQRDLWEKKQTFEILVGSSSSSKKKKQKWCPGHAPEL